VAEQSPARRIAALVGPIHNVSYYTPEIRVFQTLGVKGWWTAYFAYRSAPMGIVPPEVIAATFYGFALRMIARGVPAVWEHLTPQQALDVRVDAVDRAWRRIFAGADPSTADAVREAAVLLRQSIDGVDGGGRPLYAAHTTVSWPEPPHLQLWNATTLLREHRGDSHTIALAAAGVDPAQCQVLMVARGHGNRATLQKIRGWNDGEWDDAVRALVRRGWLDLDGALTPAGRTSRAAIEDHTDALAAEPANRLGEKGVERVTELLGPIHERLFTVGSIPGRWPPPHVIEAPAPSDTEDRD
jgi:Helix-turn-helix family